jgi:hypothetical protein
MRTGLSAAVRFCAVGVAVSGAMIACGGATTGGLGDGNGGGGGGGSSVSGSVSNTSFTVASQIAAIEVASSSCTNGFGGGPSSSSGAGSSGSGGSGDDGGETCTSSGQVVVVLLTNRADVTCGLAQSEISSGANVEFASFEELELAVINEAGNVATGTYTIVDPASGIEPGAEALFGTTSSTCTAQVNAQGTSGTITLDQIGSGAVAGSYSVTFGTQGSFSGSFNVPICEIPDAGAGSFDGGPPVCQ